MSYRFTVVAADKASAVTAIGDHLDAIIAERPDDGTGAAEVLAAAEAFIGRLRDPEAGEQIAVAVSVTAMTLDGRGVGRTAVEITATIEPAG